MLSREGRHLFCLYIMNLINTMRSRRKHKNVFNGFLCFFGNSIARLTASIVQKGIKDVESKSCCFIGHRTVSEIEKVKERLKAIALELLSQGINTFYFGSRSQFDDLAWEMVSELKEEFPHIKRIYVRSMCAELSGYYEKYLLESYEETFMPSSIENAGRASYVERNYEMIKLSDVCVFYYDENYLPARRKQTRRDLFDYQPKSGTKIAYEFAVKKDKIKYNVYQEV